MIRKISFITLLVEDQEQALDFYTEKLGFEKRQDDQLKNGIRWLVVGPKDQNDIGLVLLRADSKGSSDAVGHQAGDNVLLILHTNDCQQTFKDLKKKGVVFVGTPQERPWGLEVVFKDLYGNKFNLVQPQGWGG